MSRLGHCAGRRVKKNTDEGGGELNKGDMAQKRRLALACQQPGRVQLSLF